MRSPGAGIGSIGGGYADAATRSGPSIGWEPDPRGRWHPCLVTDVGAFLTYTAEASPIRRAPDTAPPYRGQVNEALVAWLMTAPDAPDERLALEDFLRRPEWHQRADRRGVGTRSFFSVALDNLERARAICEGCPVRDECYRYAMSDPDLMGVWAGFTAKERRELRGARVA